MKHRIKWLLWAVMYAAVVLLQHGIRGTEVNLTAFCLVLAGAAVYYIIAAIEEKGG